MKEAVEEMKSKDEKTRVLANVKMNYTIRMIRELGCVEWGSEL